MEKMHFNKLIFLPALMKQQQRIREGLILETVRLAMPQEGSEASSGESLGREAIRHRVEKEQRLTADLFISLFFSPVAFPNTVRFLTSAL